MDRFFLRALVREVAPQLVGRRARSHNPWNAGSGFTILLGTKRGRDLVVSLSPQAPGFYIGRPPMRLDGTPGQNGQPRFKKLLAGASVVNIEAASLDKVVTLDWQYTKASGAKRALTLILEWPGTRTAAFLVDSESREVLDVVSPGTPRLVPGEVFEGLEPPPGSQPLATSAEQFAERLAEVRRQGLKESRALSSASGLSPLLVREMNALVADGVPLETAFAEIARKLVEAPHPMLLSPSSYDFERKAPLPMASPISLSPPTGWSAGRFSECNEVAAAFVMQSFQLGTSRSLYLEGMGALRRRLKKVTKLKDRLEGERDGLQDPSQLRRWGELLLAGLHQAKRTGGEVMVPDPYHADSPMVRVPVDPRLDLTRNARRYFDRARKTERGRASLDERIGKTTREVDYLETLELGLRDAAGGDTLAPLVQEMREAGLMNLTSSRGQQSQGRKGPRSQKSLRSPKSISRAKAGAGKGAPTRTERRLGPRRFRLPGGATVLAGRSARSNEELTFGIARPDELWFHAAGMAGAHVVLRRPTSGTTSGIGESEEIEQAAAVAAYLSKARGSTAVEVHYCPRKNVRKIPAAPPGTVRISQYQTIRVRPELPASEADENGGSD